MTSVKIGNVRVGIWPRREDTEWDTSQSECLGSGPDPDTSFLLICTLRNSRQLCSSNRNPVTLVEDTDWVLHSWNLLGPVPHQPVVGIWGVHSKYKLCLCPSVSQVKKNYVCSLCLHLLTRNSLYKRIARRKKTGIWKKVLGILYKIGKVHYKMPTVIVSW